MAGFEAFRGSPHELQTPEVVLELIKRLDQPDRYWLGWVRGGLEGPPPLVPGEIDRGPQAVLYNLKLTEFDDGDDFWEGPSLTVLGRQVVDRLDAEWSGWDRRNWVVNVDVLTADERKSLHALATGELASFTEHELHRMYLLQLVDLDFSVSPARHALTELGREIDAQLAAEARSKA